VNNASTHEEPMEGFVVAGVALIDTEARVTIRAIPDRPGVAGLVFTRLAEHHINVDMIIQSGGQSEKNTISFTISEQDLDEARTIVDELCSELGTEQASYDPSMAKVSIVGAGMQSHPGVAASMFACLGNAGINIEMISTSEIKISCAIQRQYGHRAVEAIHAAFELEKLYETSNGQESQEPRTGIKQ